MMFNSVKLYHILKISEKICVRPIVREFSKLINAEESNIVKETDLSRLTDKLRTVSNTNPMPTERTDTINDFFKQELEDLSSVFPLIVENLTSSYSIETFPGLKERYLKLINCCVNFKDPLYLAVAVMTQYTYRGLEKSYNLTEDNVRKAAILSWCVLIIQQALVMTDDIADNAVTRYNMPVWYKRPDVTLRKAIFDSYFLENGGYKILIKYFSSHPNCLDMVKISTKNVFNCMIAQCLDSCPLPLDQFETFHKLRYYKGCYAFSNSIRSAVYLANISDEKSHQHLEDYCTELGWYGQIQNDFRDCFGVTTDTKALGNDILENKCTWLAVQALKLSSPAQKKLMEECYGKPNQESVEKIHNLYCELKLDQVYADFSADFFTRMCKKIEMFPDTLPPDVFYGTLKYLVSGHIDG